VDQVVTRVNRTVGRQLGWHIELLRWEDRQPDAGRPQSSINEDLDRADAFIGLLGSKWGTPTGAYTSGFEEEFERSLERWRADPAHRVWLYFKQIPDEQLADPGDSLKRVLAFRDRVRDQQLALYNRFVTVGELREKAFERLVTHLAELSAPSRERVADEANAVGAAGGAKASERSPSDAESTSAAATAAVPVDDELLAIVDRVREAVIRGIPPESDSGGYDGATIARTFLLAASWMNGNDRGRLTLGTHQAVTVYERCETILPSVAEVVLLLSTVLADEDPVRPAWKLLKGDPEPGRYVRIAAELLIHSRESVVRAAALGLLRRTGNAALLDRDHFVALVNDEDEAVRANAYKLLDATEETDSLLIRTAAETEAAAAVVLVRHLAVNDPPGGLALVERWSSLANVDVAATFAAARRVTRDDLLGLLGSDKRAMQIFALRAGARVLHRADVEPLLNDRFVAVRRAAVKLILDRSWKVDDEVLIRATYLGRRETLRPHPLRQRILMRSKRQRLSSRDPSDAAEPDAYAAAALEDFKRFGGAVRSDIDCDYAAWADDDERRDAMRTAGVIALAAHGDEPDIGRLEPFLLADDDPTSQAATLGFFGRVGGPIEADRLLTLGHQNRLDGVGAEHALETIARRHPEVVESLLASPDLEFREAGLRVAVDAPDRALESRIRTLLYDENWWIRKAAVSFLVKVLSEKELEALLTSYPDEGEFYFYNVMGWLDRVLYAPEPFRALYLEDLRAESTDE
jgi:hypothetical protein